jgi:integrase
MPTRQLPSGRYQARIYDADARRYVSLGTFATEKEAQHAALRAEAGVDPVEKLTTPKAIPKGREKFEKFALEVIQARKHTWSTTTYHAHLWRLDATLKPFHGIALADITYSRVAKWWASLESKPNARKVAYGTLSIVMRRAVKLGEISSSPCMIEGATKDFSKKRPTFHAVDIRMLLSLTTDVQMQAGLLLLMGTGMRVGELLALDWEDVDTTQGAVHVHRHLTAYGVREGTKSHADGERRLIMPSEAVEALLHLSRVRVPVPGTPVFLNDRGGRLSYVRFRARFDALKAAVGLDDLHIHDLRHVHLSEFARHATLRETMDRAGHTDVKSALRYQHSNVEREKAIVERLKL